MSIKQEISLEVLDEDLAQLPSKKLKAGSSWGLYREFDACVFWIKSGIVKVGSYSAEGQEDLRLLVQAQSMIGEMAVLGKSNPEDFAVAVTDCEICEIDILVLSSLFGRKPGLQVWLMELMRSRLAALESRLQSVLFKSSKERVLTFLQSYIPNFGKLEGELLTLPNYLSHTDIAQFTSTSRQTVNRVLNHLRKDGILDYNKEFLWMEKSKLSLLHEPMD